MRKIITVVLSAALVLGAFGAPAAEAGKKKKAKPRKASATYDNPSIGSSDLGGLGIGIPSFGTAANESLMTVKITDETGLPVPASVSWDTDGDGISDTGFEVCGETEEPMPIEGGHTINVFLWVLPSSTCPVGTATSGTVDVTFRK